MDCLQGFVSQRAPPRESAERAGLLPPKTWPRLTSSFRAWFSIAVEIAPAVAAGSHRGASSA